MKGKQNSFVLQLMDSEKGKLRLSLEDQKRRMRGLLQSSFHWNPKPISDN